MSGWAGALRAARRSAVRAKGRTALVVTLIALPVTVVVAGETLARTGDISVKESLPHTLGQADARIRAEIGRGPVHQLPDESSSACTCGGSGYRTAKEVLAQLPSGSRLVPFADGQDIPIEHAHGLLRASGIELDLTDALTTGMFPLASGRLPRTTAEVVVTATVADRGFPIGAVLPATAHGRTVVGVVQAAPDVYGEDAPLVIGKPGSLAGETARTWLAAVPGGVSWHQVLALNQQGLYALSREVVDHPPPASEVPTDQVGMADNSGMRTLLALVAVLAVLQVVLLAAPAFAVGARRQRRVLAMIGATGGAPKHIRRFVLAQGVVLGTVAGALGAGLGVVAGVALRPALSLVDTVPGPIDISWRDAALTAGIGAVAAVLAALIPALVAGRQDVLAGLTGRRGTRAGSLRTLVPGLIVLGVGITGCVSSARPQAGQFTIVYAALPMVLGAALLAPTAIVLLSRRVSVLPFSVRYALRDAARSRGRTAAAAAAVTATVAGAVALGIGGASDSLQGKTTYQPTGPRHSVIVSGLAGATPKQLSAIKTAVAKRMPGASQVPIRSVQSSKFFDVTDPRNPDVPLLSSYGGVVDGGAMVGEEALDLLDLPAEARASAAAALRRTGAVALVDAPGQGPVLVAEHDDSGNVVSRRTLPAYWVVSGLHPTPLIVTEAVGGRLGTVALGGLLVKGDLGKDQQKELNEELGAIGTGYASVERGWTGSDDQRLAMLVLGGTAAVLVLGGTLSSALLALADARPDFATLMAVGAPPRVRRRVAAGYAAVIGLLGSLLGTLAGLAPGIAVSFPLTRSNPPGFPDHFLAIPWALLIGLAVVVPLTAALGAALLTRSRLPLSARVES